MDAVWHETNIIVETDTPFSAIVIVTAKASECPTLLYSKERHATHFLY